METFEEYLQQWPTERRSAGAARATGDAVLAVLEKESLTPADFLTLLSPAAQPHLEALARRAHGLTQRYFGRAVNIFTPLYIANYCTNHCRDCGFNANKKHPRRHRRVDEA